MIESILAGLTLGVGLVGSAAALIWKAAEMKSEILREARLDVGEMATDLNVFTTEVAQRLVRLETQMLALQEQFKTFYLESNSLKRDMMDNNSQFAERLRQLAKDIASLSEIDERKSK